jgi:hypothetical protein
MSVGPVVVAAGLALLARSTTDSFYPTGILPAVIVFGLGLAITVAPLTSTAMNSLASGHAGLASAVNNDVARLGSLIAVAVIPAIAGIGGSGYLHPSTLSSGFRTSVWVAASMCVIGGLLAAAGIQNDVHPRVAREQCFNCPLDGTALARRG